MVIGDSATVFFVTDGGHLCSVDLSAKSSSQDIKDITRWNQSCNYTSFGREVLSIKLLTIYLAWSRLSTVDPQDSSLFRFDPIEIILFVLKQPTLNYTSY